MKKKHKNVHVLKNIVSWYYNWGFFVLNHTTGTPGLIFNFQQLASAALEKEEQNNSPNYLNLYSSYFIYYVCLLGLFYTDLNFHQLSGNHYQNLVLFFRPCSSSFFENQTWQVSIFNILLVASLTDLYLFLSKLIPLGLCS